MNIQNMTTNFDQLKQKIPGAFSKPPKVELKGTLIPNTDFKQGPYFQFKLATDSREYLLSMNPGLANLAKKIEWESVAVKGYIDMIAKEIEVEKISLAHATDPPKYGGLFNENLNDIEEYKRTIEHEGKIGLDDLAS